MSAAPGVRQHRLPQGEATRRCGNGADGQEGGEHPEEIGSHEAGAADRVYRDARLAGNCVVVRGGHSVAGRFV